MPITRYRSDAPAVEQHTSVRPSTLAGYGITDAASDGELSAHEADTTNVHGIANTAVLVVTTDARLSDARTPTAHALNSASHTGTAAYSQMPSGTGSWDPGAGARTTLARAVSLGTQEGTIEMGAGGSTSSKLNVWTTNATPVAAQRTSSATNASYLAQTTAGGVYFGQGTAGEFAVDDDADLTDAPFRVNASTGATRIGGALTLANPGTATTVGAAGAASALPAAPVGYITVTVGATAYKVPYFNS